MLIIVSKEVSMAKFSHLHQAYLAPILQSRGIHRLAGTN